MTPRPVIEPLDPAKHDRAAFSCGVDPLDRYLKQQANQDAKARVAAVHVLHAEGSDAIIGYYTLCASAIELDALPDDIRKRMPRYPHVPCVLLGRLAVDERYRGKGWGAFLLVDALKRGFRSHTSIAAMAVVVDAKDDAAEAFYAKFGFRQLSTGARRLFLPMKTIADLP